MISTGDIVTETLRHIEGHNRLKILMDFFEVPKEKVGLFLLELKDLSIEERRDLVEQIKKGST